jgi:hypothetical protein
MCADLRRCRVTGSKHQIGWIRIEFVSTNRLLVDERFAFSLVVALLTRLCHSHAKRETGIPISLLLILLHETFDCEIRRRVGKGPTMYSFFSGSSLLSELQDVKFIESPLSETLTLFHSGRVRTCTYEQYDRAKSERKIPSLPDSRSTWKGDCRATYLPAHFTGSPVCLPTHGCLRVPSLCTFQRYNPGCMSEHWFTVHNPRQMHTYE